MRNNAFSIIIIGNSPNKTHRYKDCGIIIRMNKQYTSAQVAEMLGYSRSMILLVCQRKDLPRVGKQYVLGEDEIKSIKDALGHKPTGRPRKNKE